MKGNRNLHALKLVAIIGAALTYAGAVIYGDIMFLQVVARAFPANGILQALAYAGAVVTAISALVLPIALHWWFSPGLQFVWGMIYWFVDIAALGMNSILSYALSTGGTLDSFLMVWQMIAPATPMLAVVGWGLAFILDPSHKVRHAVSEMEADQIDTYADEMKKAAASPEVYAVILEAAKRHARDFAESVRGRHIEVGQGVTEAVARRNGHEVIPSSRSLNSTTEAVDKRTND